MKLLTMLVRSLILGAAVVLSVGNICLGGQEAGRDVLADRLFGRWVADEELTKRGYTKEDESADIAFEREEGVEKDIPKSIAAFVEDKPVYATGTCVLLPGSEQPRKYKFLLTLHDGMRVLAWWSSGQKVRGERGDGRFHITLVLAEAKDGDLLFLRTGGEGGETLAYARWTPPPESLPWKKRNIEHNEAALAKRLEQEGLLPEGVKAENVGSYPELTRLFVQHDNVRRWILALVKDDEATWEWRGTALGVVLKVKDEHRELLLEALKELVSWSRTTRGKTRQDFMVRQKTAGFATDRAMRIEDPGRECLEIMRIYAGGAWKEWLTRIAQRGPPANPEMLTDWEKARRKAEGAGARTLLQKFGQEDLP